MDECTGAAIHGQTQLAGAIPTAWSKCTGAAFSAAPLYPIPASPGGKAGELDAQHSGSGRPRATSLLALRFCTSPKHRSPSWGAGAWVERPCCLSKDRMDGGRRVPISRLHCNMLTRYGQWVNWHCGIIKSLLCLPRLRTNYTEGNGPMRENRCTAIT